MLTVSGECQAYLRWPCRPYAILLVTLGSPFPMGNELLICCQERTRSFRRFPRCLRLIFMEPGGASMGSDDADLIRRWQRGDATAFEAIVRRWQQPMGRF